MGSRLAGLRLKTDPRKKVLTQERRQCGGRGHVIGSQRTRGDWHMPVGHKFADAWNMANPNEYRGSATQSYPGNPEPPSM